MIMPEVSIKCVYNIIYRHYHTRPILQLQKASVYSNMSINLVLSVVSTNESSAKSLLHDKSAVLLKNPAPRTYACSVKNKSRTSIDFHRPTRSIDPYSLG